MRKRKKDLYEIMTGNRRKTFWEKLTKRQKYLALILSVLFLLSLLFTYGPAKFRHVPSWEDIYRKTGLYGEQSEVFRSPLCVTYLDVGQGDCMIIKQGDSFMLIDSGDTGQEHKIEAELRKQGCHTVSYLISTHPHQDHFGSFEKLLPKLDVEQALLPKVDIRSLEEPYPYQQFLKALETRQVKQIPAVPGTEYRLGEASFTILAPLSESENLNNISIVILLKYKEKSFLFTGDAEEEEEAELIRRYPDLRADVYKCGHHGSKTSSSEPFLQRIKPEIAVISCGNGNSYGHPHTETVTRLQQKGVRIYRTDRQGTVYVATDGTKLSPITEKRTGNRK